VMFEGLMRVECLEGGDGGVGIGCGVDSGE